MIRAEAANKSMIEVKEVIARVRKEAEDAMMKVKKGYEQMLRQITTTSDQVADGIILIDGGGILLSANLMWAATHRHDTTDELTGKHLSAFHTKKQNAFVRDFVEEATQRGRLAGPVDRVLSDGTVFCSQAGIGDHNG